MQLEKPPSTNEQRLLHFFPLGGSLNDCHLETTGAVLRPAPQPEGDLLPGADLRRFAVQGFLDVSPASPRAGMIVAPLEAYLLRLDHGAPAFEALGNDQNWKEVLPEELKGLVLAGATPLADANHVYAIFGTGDLACLAHDGESIWSRGFGLPRNAYGHTASLEKHGNLLLVQIDQGTPDSPASKLLALDSENRQTVRGVRRAVPASWSTPCVARLSARAHLCSRSAGSLLPRHSLKRIVN